MSRNRDHSKRPEPGDEGPSPLLQTAVFGALGFQFVAVVVSTYFLGDWVDTKYDSSPWGVVVLMALGLVGTGIHTVRITRRFVALHEEEESGD